MVEQDLIEKFQLIASRLESSRGPIALFALLKMDEITDRWTVILSASWVNEQDRGDIFFELRTLLIDTLESDQHFLIARIGLFTSDEHLVELMLDRYRKGDHIERDQKINGNLIHEGYILVCNNRNFHVSEETD